jgi:hypothetical protein
MYWNGGIAILDTGSFNMKLWALIYTIIYVETYKIIRFWNYFLSQNCTYDTQISNLATPSDPF